MESVSHQQNELPAGLTPYDQLTAEQKYEVAISKHRHWSYLREHRIWHDQDSMENVISWESFWACQLAELQTANVLQSLGFC